VEGDGGVVVSPTSPVVPKNRKVSEVVFAKNQPEYIPLPAIYKDGIVTTRWSLSWKERIRILFSGSLWLMIATFGEPLQPVKMSAECPIGKEDQ